MTSDIEILEYEISREGWSGFYRWDKITKRRSEATPGCLTAFLFNRHARRLKRTRGGVGRPAWASYRRILVRVSGSVRARRGEEGKLAGVARARNRFAKWKRNNGRSRRGFDPRLTLRRADINRGLFIRAKRSGALEKIASGVNPLGLSNAAVADFFIRAPTRWPARNRFPANVLAPSRPIDPRIGLAAKWQRCRLGHVRATRSCRIYLAHPPINIARVEKSDRFAANVFSLVIVSP